MKKFLAVAALLAVTSANAEKLKFGDLNYFLQQGEYNLTVDAIINNETSQSDTVENEVDNYFLNSTIAYAVNNSLNFTFGLNLLLDGETEIGGAGSDDAYGFQNPKFGANYRVMNQSDSGFNFDVGAIATIKLIDREIGSGDNDEGNSIETLYSNYGDPRSGLDLNARFGKKWNEANEFYLLTGVNIHLPGDYERLENNSTVDLESSVDFRLGGFYQYRPVNEFMITLGLTGTRYSEIEGEVSSQDFTISDHIDYQFLFNAKYLVTENIVAKFLVTQDSRGDFDFDQASNTEVTKRHALQYGLGVDYLF